MKSAPKVLVTLEHWIVTDQALLSQDGRIEIPRHDIGRKDRNGLLYHARYVDDWRVIPRDYEHAFIVACGFWGLIIPAELILNSFKHWRSVRFRGLRFADAHEHAGEWFPQHEYDFDTMQAALSSERHTRAEAVTLIMWAARHTNAGIRRLADLADECAECIMRPGPLENVLRMIEHYRSLPPADAEALATDAFVDAEMRRLKLKPEPSRGDTAAAPVIH